MKISTIIGIIFINIKIWFLKLIGRSDKIIPYKVLLNLTDLCNSRCQYCEIWKIKPVNEINLEDIKKFLKDINKNIYWLALSGGEVTLVNYYYDLIDEIVKICKNLKILAFTTNALAPEKTLAYAKYAKEKGLDVLITISLDGDKETHDKLRGIPGNYDKCQKTYNLLKKEGIKCYFGITLSEQNKNFVEKKYNEVKNKLKAVTFVHGDGIYKVNKKVNDEAILDSLKIIYKNYVVKNIPEIVEKIHVKISQLFLKESRQKNIIPCEVLNASVHIMPSGDVKPCMFMDAIGNIKNQNFSSIMSSAKAKLSKDIVKKNNCPKCWLNCYSPHSIMQHPIKSVLSLFRK